MNDDDFIDDEEDDDPALEWWTDTPINGRPDPLDDLMPSTVQVVDEPHDDERAHMEALRDMRGEPS